MILFAESRLARVEMQQVLLLTQVPTWTAMEITISPTSLLLSFCLLFVDWTPNRCFGEALEIVQGSVSLPRKG